MARTVVFGPGLTSGRRTRSADTAVEAWREAGHDIVKLRREPGQSSPAVLRSAAQALLGADCLLLLPGWEDTPEAVVLAQLATAMGLDTYAWGDTEDPRRLGVDDARAPLLPGQGIIAPDSDDTEMPHEEAARIVLGPRGAFYDTPLRNLGRTGLIWTGILYGRLKPGEVISAEDVSLCMVGVKLARQAYRHKRDNLTDAHGYLMTVEMIRQEKDRLRAEGLCDEPDN